VDEPFEIRPATEGDAARIAHLGAQTFHNHAPSAATAARLDTSTWDVLTIAGEVQATAQIRDGAQLFGGRPVPAAFVHALMVAPEARSRGLGGELLRAGLAAAQARGAVLASVFPSSPAPYRRSGFEFSGTRTRYAASLEHVPASSLPVVPWGDEVLAEVQECYRTFAASTTGLVDRPDWWWQERILHPTRGELLYRYLVRDPEDGRVTGYVVFEHDADPARFAHTFVRADTRYPYRIACREFVWTDLAAAQALLGLMATNWAVGTELEWVGPAEEPLAMLFPRREPQVRSSQWWMSLLLDPIRALEARGYPRSVSTSVDLCVLDSTPDGGAALTLTVDRGVGRVGSAASAPTAVVDRGALAAMFTGWLPASDASRLGRLRGADPDQISSLQQLFGGGPRPWSLDVF
jgi:predicted acetyltransferase